MVLVVGLTVMTLVFSPFDQMILPLLQLPVKLVELPLQIVPGLLAVKLTLGAAGMGFTVTPTPAEASLVQFPIVHFTV